MSRAAGVFVLLLAFALPAEADAVRLAKITRDFSAPVYATAEGRSLYVVTQPGRIWRREGSTWTVFLDIRDDVLCCGERGLFSLDFDAEFAANRFFYVNYTDNGGDIVFARFRANARFTSGVVGSRRVLFTVEHSASQGHNGGQIVWGPDGRLHMSTGDGDGTCDVGLDAQNPDSWLGKLFSLDPRDLTIPPKLEAYGLRNPWRFSFDWSKGRLYLADVGEHEWEEVNTQPVRSLATEVKNYGWNVYEAFAFNSCGNETFGGTSPHRPPIATYSHTEGCSITGGFVSRGRALREFRGWYVFGDFCTGKIWRLRVRNGALVQDRQLVLDTDLNITSFGENRYGDLLVVDHGGAVYRLVP